ncbi:MAG: U32 family peptidase [Bacilli bacterium]|nr:U32 family peptidase [Bacilli bacterium]
MSKIITIPSSIEEIEKTKHLVDGFIIGIKDMSVNTNMLLEDLSILDSLRDKDIFISINKNMHNGDLPIVEKLLNELNNYDIKGVMYYDVAVLSIYKKLDLNYDLVWAQEHASTNYNTINYWNSFDVKYTYISNDITEEDVVTISKNCKAKLMVNLFGYLPMFVSKRHIVKNYLEYFDLKDESSVNYIEKEDKIYPIIDNNIGTSVFSSNILNGIKSYLNLDIEYTVLNSFGIELDKFIEVINLFKSVNKDNVLEYEEKINNMFSNVDRGFLDKKTIYRVKKYDK